MKLNTGSKFDWSLLKTNDRSTFIKLNLQNQLQLTNTIYIYRDTAEQLLLACQLEFNPCQKIPI